MADIRSSQNIAQVEWLAPLPSIKSFQTLAQVEWEEGAVGWTGKICRLTNPAKINGVAVADIANVMRVS